MAAIDDQARSATSALPRDNLIRASFPADIEIRESADNGMGTLTGHFAVFNDWTEIASMWEGNFMERIAPGAFDKTIRENVPHMRVLFNHGNDPSIGDKVLGPIQSVEADKTGARYSVPLLDTSYNRDLLPGLRAGVYGASFRFKVVREEIKDQPDPSEANPRGLPERTITEAQVMEFGPVTFPAYAGATAGVRSLTDRFRLAELKPNEINALKERMDTEDLATLAEMIQLGASYIDDQDEPDDQKNVPVMESALAILASLVPVEVAETEPDETEDEEASRVEDADVQTRETTETLTSTTETLSSITTTPSAPPHPAEKPRRGTQTDDRRADTPIERKIMQSIEEMQARHAEIKVRLAEIAAEFRGQVLDESARAEWDGLAAEREQIVANCKAEDERRSYMDAINDESNMDTPTTTTRDTGTYVTKRDGKNKTPDNAFDLLEYHGRARDHGQLMELYTDGAKRAVESFHYPHERADEAKVSAHIERLLEGTDGPDRSFARRVISCGSPTYRRAFWKTVKGDSLTADEQRAMAQADMETRTEAMGLLTGGGIAPVPIQIDPTIVLTSNGVLNPIRQLARVVNTTSFIWQGVTSAGAVAQYQAEAAVAINNAGSLVAPQIQPERVTSFIPYSWELAQDWGALESELAQQIQDAKDTLEATKFALGAGHGSNEPRGILVGAGTVVATSNGTTGTGFALSDVYLVEAALPPRYMPNAAWAASPAVFQKVRQFAAAAGPGAWAESLIVGNPPTLLGYPAYKCSTIGTSIGAGLVAGAIWGVLGDWSRYVITDRLGMGIRVIPNLFGGTAGVHFPTGQSGLYAYWRNSADVIDSNGFRVGTISKGVN